MNERDPQPGRLETIEDCWNRVGVKGNGGCPDLKTHVHCRNCPRFAAAGRQLFHRAPPVDYVEHWTRQIAEGHPGRAGDTVAVLVFQLGEEWLALDVGCAVEVTSPRMVHRVPHRSDRLLMGLVNIRGRLELCVSLGELLGIQTHGSAPAGVARRLFLVGECSQVRWVFPVDWAMGVHRVPFDRLGNVPATVANSAKGFSQAVFTLDTRRVGYLDADRLFSALRKAVG